MNYRKVYMRIISHAKSEQQKGLRPRTKNCKKGFENQYFEFHHILPRSLFPNWIKRKSNTVPLTAREHFFCHQLLTKIYPHSSMWRALAAFQRRSKGQKRILSAHQYEICKIASSKAQKGKVPWNKGIPRTEKEKEKLRKPRLTTRGENNPSKRLDVRKKLSETKLGPKNPRAMHWIIKDIETNEIWDFVGGLKRWTKEHGFKYIGTLRQNKHPRYKILLAEKKAS